MKKIPSNILSHLIIAFVLLIAFTAIYWMSIPASFNTVPENRKYFDSDGEFITRQFRQGKTFTHNDHLLYHILGKSIYSSSNILQEKTDVVTPHKLLSVLFGALGVALLYIFGALITTRTVLPLVCAVFAGGTAGWWFFSATIDTYVPCLSVSIPVLGLAVLSLKSNNRYNSFAIGALAGLAFLFRTDSFLLALMGIYLLMNRKHIVGNSFKAGTTGIVVALLGYALLSSTCYNIDFNPSAMWQWMSGSMNRPESADECIWGVTQNLTPYNAALMFVNQFFYTILMPGLLKTRGADFYLRYVKGGWIPLLLWVGVFATALFHLCRRISREHQCGSNEPLYAALLAGVWFFSRMVFYTWWDPHDPFLFALMAMPALWLVILLGFHYAFQSGLSKRTEMAHWSLLGIITLAVWLHNIYYMIEPLRNT